MIQFRILKFNSGFLIYCVHKNLINYIWVPSANLICLHFLKLQQNILGNLIGFKKWLYVNGFGFRTSLQSFRSNKKLGFKIGFSHNIFYRLSTEIGLKRFTAVLKGLGKFKYGKIKVILFKTNNLKIIEVLLNTLKKLRQINAYKLKGLYFRNQIYTLKKIKKKTKTRS